MTRFGPRVELLRQDYQLFSLGFSLASFYFDCTYVEDVEHDARYRLDHVTILRSYNIEFDDRAAFLAYSAYGMPISFAV